MHCRRVNWQTVVISGSCCFISAGKWVDCVLWRTVHNSEHIILSPEISSKTSDDFYKSWDWHTPTHMKQDQQKLQHQLILGISRSFTIIIEKKLCTHLPNISCPAGIALAFPIRKEACFSLCDTYTFVFSFVCVGINWSMQVSRNAKQAGQGLTAALWSQAFLLTNKHALFFFSFSTAQELL